MPKTSDAIDYVGEGLYRVKRIRFPQELSDAAAPRAFVSRPIVLQNENGPCPLIALCNVLLLCGDLDIHPDIAVISNDQLCDMLLGHLRPLKPPSLAAAADFKQNVEDAIALVPSLSRGLDVNVKFGGVDQFEFTNEQLLFDLLDIPLVHCWLPDPAAEELAHAVISPMSYNSLVELIVSETSSAEGSKRDNGKSKEGAVDEDERRLVCRSFLEQHPSQMTYHGLFELNKFMRDDEFVILFRNNHFSTVYKFKAELFQLCTDQGYFNVPVCWERLSSVEGGSSEMCTDLFTVYEAGPDDQQQDAAIAAAAVAGVEDRLPSGGQVNVVPAAEPAIDPASNEHQQQDMYAAQSALLKSPEELLVEERDAQLAAQLQAEEKLAAQTSALQLRGSSGQNQMLLRASDEELARQLQMEEAAAARAEQPVAVTAAEKLAEVGQDGQPQPVKKQPKPKSAKKKSGVNAYSDQAKALREANEARRQRSGEFSSNQQQQQQRSQQQQQRSQQQRLQQAQQRQDGRKDNDKCTIQ